MGAEPRMTLSTQRVLLARLDTPQRELYGRELGELAGLRSSAQAARAALGRAHRPSTARWLQPRLGQS